MNRPIHGKPGPVMLDLAGTEMTADERQRLLHPLVGGVILFTRNFASPEQLCALTQSIHDVRGELIVAVDHEGGRVQRFRSGFTRLPPMRALGLLWERDPAAALAAARAAGHVLAAELRACGVDLSFTPVLDLDYGTSGVIGDRAFHRDPRVVGALAGALIGGLAEAGMASVGKHFPGHGYVAADSHLDVPVDTRTMEEIRQDDLLPYGLHREIKLAAVMPAHVIYPQVDARPAGFSSVWLQTILRGELGFNGVIFSDDLSMEGARVAGGIVERAEAALGAGCDMVLVCNAPGAADELLERWQPQVDAASTERLQRLLPATPAIGRQVLTADESYRLALDRVSAVSVA